MTNNLSQPTVSTDCENQTRRLLLKGILCTFSSIALVQHLPANASAKQIYTKGRGNVALGGYDAVTYFADGQPKKGKKKFTTQYKGANWRFSSQENINAFALNPEAYELAYGGYCAYSITVGKLVKGDPKLWEIVNDKLYLNYNRNVHKRWQERSEVMIERGDKNWPAILN